MFDASIFNSRILTITLEGDMAFRISWGDQPDFLVSVGGFHPVYNATGTFELLAMKRITVNILSGNPSLVLTSYFAVTTNTIQFGASIDFTFKVSKFSAVGDFGFDVLIQFSPFRFLANVHASISLNSEAQRCFLSVLNLTWKDQRPGEPMDMDRSEFCSANSKSSLTRRGAKSRKTHYRQRQYYHCSFRNLKRMRTGTQQRSLNPLSL